MSKKLEQFWVLDFDRCLADVDELSEHFLDITEHVASIDRSQIEQARRDAEAQGRSFDQYAAIQASVSPEQMRYIATQFVADSAPEQYLMPGASALLDYVMHTPERAGGILTYGSGDWQRLKIRAALGSRAVPYVIVAHPHKSREISSWYDADSASFRIPPVLSPNDTAAGEIVLVDDKAVAFDGLPEHARGYWFQAAELLPSQEGTVGDAVTIVRQSLDTIIEQENRSRIDTPNSYV